MPRRTGLQCVRRADRSADSMHERTVRELPYAPLHSGRQRRAGTRIRNGVSGSAARSGQIMKTLSISLILCLVGCVGSDPIVFDSSDASAPEAPQETGSGGSGGDAPIAPSRDAGSRDAAPPSSGPATGSGGSGGVGGAPDDAGPATGGASASSASSAASSSGAPNTCHEGGISCPPWLPVGWSCDHESAPPPIQWCMFEGFSGDDLYCCPE